MLKNSNFASNLLLILILGIVLTDPSFANEEIYFENYKPSVTFNNLKFSNRAACGADSLKATEKVFLFTDSYIVGKLGHNLAKSTGNDPSKMSQSAMFAYRKTLNQLILNISDLLIKQSLPLLPSNLEDPRSPSVYKNLAKQYCSNQNYCSALDDMIRKIWTRAANSQNGLALVPTSSSRSQLSCRYIKNFSSFESPLYTALPEAMALTRIAQDSLNRTEFIGNCNDPTLASRHFALEFDLINSDPTTWEKFGFDYWNSLRIYLAWAWRNLPLKNYGADIFAEAFRSLSIEESLIFVPAGCESFVPPSCDSSYLSLNSLRELAQKGIPDSSKELPVGPDEELIRNPQTGVNTDILDLQGAESPSDWIKNFTSKSYSNSLLLKNRFNEGLNHLALLNYNLDATALVTQIETMTRSLEKSSDESSLETSKLHKKLYLMCAEYEYAANENYQILKRKLERFKDFSFLRDTANQWDEAELAVLQAYYAKLSQSIFQLCERLEKKNFWDGLSEQIDPKDYAPWFRELIGQNESSEKPDSEVPNGENENLEGNLRLPALLKLRDPTTAQGRIVCQDAIDCVRLALSSSVAVYSALSYAESMLPFTSVPKGAALFNPYAERVACKVYDPWFKTRSAIGELLVDLANTAAFGWNDIPVFVSVDIQRGQVIRFKESLENGLLKFEPIKEKNKIIPTLGVDFSSFTGVPCNVAIKSGDTHLSPGMPYDFLGISTSRCHSSEKHHLEVEGDGAANLSGPARGACVSCHLNFARAAVGVGSRSVSGGFNPLKLAIYLFRSFSRFRSSMKDQHNVPRRIQIDVNQTTLTYLRHGYIPKKCVKRLQKGSACNDVSTCEAKAADYLRKKVGGFAKALSSQSVDRNIESIVLQSTQCKGKIKLKVRHTFKNCALGMKVIEEKGEGTCSGLL